MKIKVSEGCIWSGIEVNGENFNDLSKDQKLEIIKICLSKADNYDFNEILKLLVSLVYDDADHESGDCDQCGDRWSTSIYKINDED